MASRSQLRARRLRTGSIGVVGTLLLHSLVVLPLFLDLSLAARKAPNRSGAGASAVVSTAEPVMTVVFINEPSTTAERRPSMDSEFLASRGLAPVDLPVFVLSPDPLPAADAVNQEDEQNRSAPPDVAGDQAQHALLYGRYLGQVQARIERAWMRPRADIGAPMFSCRARIEQGRRGDVIGIQLDHCNGSARWQQSLVSAIRTASPLPAPPDQAVYTDRLWLSFRSAGFRPGGPAEGFEPENRTARVDSSDQSFQNFARRINRNSRYDTEDPDVIHLTIIGSPTGPGSVREPVGTPPPVTTSEVPFSTPQ